MQQAIVPMGLTLACYSTSAKALWGKGRYSLTEDWDRDERGESLLCLGFTGWFTKGVDSSSGYRSQA